ncbi:hypothetical protein LTR85_008285 [Meristemomyces frigidus]|nr:hypothetical protein LTR85_008285 [Meristemomyces frigidus]
MSRLTSLAVRRRPNINPPLFSLPGELRNRIYSLVFADIEDEVVLPITRPKRKLREKLKRKLLIPHGKRVPHLALLMTCRQIRAEAFQYVHGTVHAELATRNGTEWLVNCLLSDSLRQEMRKALKAIGGVLPFVTHLNLSGAGTLAMLTLKQDPGIVARRHSSDILVWRGAKLSDTFAAVRGWLPKVRCVTIFDKSFDLMMDVMDTDLWFLLVLNLMSRNGRDLVAVAFPLLTEMRLESKTLGKRFQRKACGRWHEWYGGARIPYMEF